MLPQRQNESPSGWVCINEWTAGTMTLWYKQEQYLKCKACSKFRLMERQYRGVFVVGICCSSCISLNQFLVFPLAVYLPGEVSSYPCSFSTSRTILYLRVSKAQRMACVEDLSIGLDWLVPKKFNSLCLPSFDWKFVEMKLAHRLTSAAANAFRVPWTKFRQDALSTLKCAWHPTPPQNFLTAPKRNLGRMLSLLSSVHGIQLRRKTFWQHEDWMKIVKAK